MSPLVHPQRHGRPAGNTPTGIGLPQTAGPDARVGRADVRLPQVDDTVESAISLAAGPDGDAPLDAPTPAGGQPMVSPELATSDPSTVDLQTTAPAQSATPHLLKKRRRLRVGDTISTATLGPRTRLVRSLLSAIGIAIGIAALIAMLGLPASQLAEFRKQMDEAGANLIHVYPGQDQQSNQVYPLPETAPAMIERIKPVTSVLAMRMAPDARVYRNDKIPVNQSGTVSAAVAQGNLLATLKVGMNSGRWFDDSSKSLPTVVLGNAAAQALGVGIDNRIWIDRKWWAVIGVLEPMSLAGELDATAFLAEEVAAETYPDMSIEAIYVAALPGKAASVKSVVAATANPANPRNVQVDFLSGDLLTAQDMGFEMLQTLSLGLGAVALLVGGIGIANTMVVAVMERRGEVGLRRAMGARTGQIALQFVREAAVIGLTGGIIGVALGVFAVYCYTAANAMAFAVPAWSLAAGPGISMLIGALAGLYPSLKAARLSPTVALRAI